nr:hypothetical protein [Acrocarpospora phusangensis]
MGVGVEVAFAAGEIPGDPEESVVKDPLPSLPVPDPKISSRKMAKAEIATAPTAAAPPITTRRLIFPTGGGAVTASRTDAPVPWFGLGTGAAAGPGTWPAIESGIGPACLISCRSRSVAGGLAEGSLAKHAWMASIRWGGTPERSGAVLRMPLIRAGTVSPGNGWRPVAANTIVPAQLKMSDAAPTRSPLNCSGDMYAGVPIGPDASVVESNAFAMPKSITIGPSGPTSTLPGLKSRCTIPAS